MAAGTTGTTERANSIQAILTTRVEYEYARQRIWDQFSHVPPEGVLGGVNSAQTVTIRFQQRLSPKTDTINEKADITPERITDNVYSVTINEYGNAEQDTRFSELVTKGDVRNEKAEVMAENMVSSMDRVAGRQYYQGNAVVLRPNGNTARSGLDATNDTLKASSVGMGYVNRATAILRGARAPGFRTDGKGQQQYATVVHTGLAQDLPEMSGFLPALQYKDNVDTLFNGEMGNTRGLSWTESPQGKLYLGAGATAQAATTLNGAVTAGATSIIVTSAAGLSVGDIITLGTLEDGATVTTETDTDGSPTPMTNENVLITAVSGTTLTIAGLGYVSGDVSTPGLKYNHANAAAVTEAADVAAIPVFGPMSVMKAYSSEVGEFGKAVVSGPFDVLQRFANIGWYAVMGWARTSGLWTVRLEVATAFPSIAVNE